MKKKYRTVIISDIHLGKPISKIDELVRFLDGVECEKLIINGDYIDFWQLGILGRWTQKDTRFMNYIINLTEKGTKLVYVKGNHDSFIKHLGHINLYDVSIVNDMTYALGNGKKYYICHGDRFDYVCYYLPNLAKLMNLLYTIIYLIERGLHRNKDSFFPLAEKIKGFFKKNLFPQKMLYKKVSKRAKDRNFEGIIFGHYHVPDRKLVDGVDCINSGDWIISCSAIVEDMDGNLELIYY